MYTASVAIRIVSRRFPPPQHPASAFPKATEVEGPVLSPAHMSVDPKEPMQLDRVLLSPSERPRRLEVCMYCGKSGHYIGPSLPVHVGVMTCPTCITPQCTSVH